MVQWSSIYMYMLNKYLIDISPSVMGYCIRERKNNNKIYPCLGISENNFPDGLFLNFSFSNHADVVFYVD